MRFSGNKVIGPHKDGMADELAVMANAASGIIVLGVDDKSREIRGISLEKLDLVGGRKPVYRLLDDSELMLTIFAAQPPHGED